MKGNPLFLLCNIHDENQNGDLPLPVALLGLCDWGRAPCNSPAVGLSGQVRDLGAAHRRPQRCPSGQKKYCVQKNYYGVRISLLARRDAETVNGRTVLPAGTSE